MKALFILLLILTQNLFAQINSLDEALELYPLNIGDYWEYETISNEPGLIDSSWKHYTEAIGDTIVNGNKYFIFAQAKLGSDDKFLSYYRVDSVTANVYRLLGDKEELTDSLYAQLNDTLFYCYYVKSIEEKEVFNEVRLTRFVDQWCASNTAYDGYELTKGLGLTYKYYNEVFLYSFYEYTYLRYAKINGIEYGIKTSVDKELELPQKFSLSQNYPNPFNPSTTIKFTIPNVGTSRDLSLRVYDILGREIQTLLNKPMQPGSYEVEFDGSDLTSGVYLYVLETGGKRLGKKMLLVK